MTFIVCSTSTEDRHALLVIRLLLLWGFRLLPARQNHFLGNVPGRRFFTQFTSKRTSQTTASGKRVPGASHARFTPVRSSYFGRLVGVVVVARLRQTHLRHVQTPVTYCLVMLPLHSNRRQKSNCRQCVS